jgi:preprotein translocase subunit SecD
VVSNRLGGSRAARVSTTGGQLVVELFTSDPEDLRVAKDVIADPGRVQFQRVDDEGTPDIFGNLHDDDLPADEGLRFFEETAPDGLDQRTKLTVKSLYVRMGCRSAKYPDESLSSCLSRFRAWASRLHVPGDHSLGFEAVREPVSGSDPLQFKQVGWRTIYMNAPAELTQEAITDTSVIQDQKNGGQYGLLLTFSAAGSKLFEQLTGENVNRRFAIVIDDVVDSAPVIKQQIHGGRATITMGAGDPEEQLRDAKRLEKVLQSGALPAPIHLVREDMPPSGR